MLSVAEKIKNSSTILLKEVQYSTFNRQEFIELFKKFQDKGTIFPQYNFDQNYYQITDGVRSGKLSFDIDEIMFKVQAKKRKFEFGVEDVVKALKAFSLLVLNNHSVPLTCIIVSTVKLILLQTKYFSPEIEDIKAFRRLRKNRENNCYYKYVGLALDFLDYFDLMSIDERYYEIIEEVQMNASKYSVRNLPTFESMFKLSEIIDDYIVESKDGEREKFFPIILWWKITSQIPLRTIEFTVTPYDCQSYENGGYYVFLRRSIMKGVKGQHVYEHNVEDNYQIQKIRINKETYDLISEYKSLVDKYDFIENFYGENRGSSERRKYLLSHRSFCAKSSCNNPINTNRIMLDYFDSGCIYSLLNQFYITVVRKKFDVIEKVSISDSNESKKGPLKVNGYTNIQPFEVELVQPMDTRHFAIMNLLLQDFPLIAIKRLAGHNDINTTKGYADHMEQYIENYTYYLARRRAKHECGEKTINIKLNEIPYGKIEYFLPKIRNNEIKANMVENGWCIYKDNDFNPCKEHDFECSNGCHYYIPDYNGKSIQNAITTNKDSIMSSLEVIKELIKNRNILKDFDIRYRTEINRINANISQTADMYKENMIKFIKSEGE